MKKIIYLEDAIDALERKKDKNAKGDIGGFYNKIIQNDIDTLMQLPSAQPEIEERMSETEQNVPNDDFISRKGAIDAVETKIKKWNAVDGEGYYVGLGLRYMDVINTLAELPSAQPEIIRCNDCMHNGSFDTDCPIDWAGKDYCNFA